MNRQEKRKDRLQVKKIEELERISVEEFKGAAKIPLVVVLDNVRSLNNIGSVFRTADAFRVEAIYLCGITATPPHAEIHKTALGAENSVYWEYFATTEDAIRKLREKAYFIYALEQANGSVMLDKLSSDAAKPYAIVLGNEVKGVSQPVVDMCDACVEIPQYGTKHSLNVSIAGGIAIWNFFLLLKNQSPV